MAFANPRGLRPARMAMAETWEYDPENRLVDGFGMYHRMEESLDDWIKVFGDDPLYGGLGRLWRLTCGSDCSRAIALGHEPRLWKGSYLDHAKLPGGRVDAAIVVRFPSNYTGPTRVFCFPSEC